VRNAKWSVEWKVGSDRPAERGVRRNQFVSLRRAPNLTLQFSTSLGTSQFALCTYTFPFFISSINWSVDRTVMAMMVSVGFWQAIETKQEPSMT
jgi:hypothetical protein